MRKHHAVNERTKREYLVYLKEAKRQSESSVDAVAAALSRFESYTRYRDFKTFHHQLLRDDQGENPASIRMRMRRGWADGGRA